MDPNAFVNPPVAYRIVPSWFWNSAIDEGEIVRQIREMSEKGIGGFCLSARPGLHIPYLSKVWFERVKLAVETAQTHGLQVWLQDGYPYPGEMSGERVTLGYPQYRAQYLTFRETTVQGGQQVNMELPWATVLRAIAVPLRRDRCLWEDAEDINDYIGSNHCQEVYRESTDREEYHPRQYFAQQPVHRLFWKAPTGRWRVLVFLQQAFEAPAHFDPFNPKAVEHFIKTTYGLYATHLGAHFGSVIPGILTTTPPHKRSQLPWSAFLPRAFRERNGYDLLACLPALITGFGPQTTRIRYDYFQTLSELLRDNSHRACADWCAQQGVHYAADAPVFRNAHQNDIHIPGTSGGREKVGASEIRGWENHAAVFRWNPKFPSSLMHQRDKQRVFNTCFHGTGWSLTLQDMKWTIDRLGALGCNLFNFHAFFYTLDGLRKHDAPPSQFHQNPYWKHFRLLADYVGRISYTLSRGRHVADLALLDPTTSLWAHLGHPGLDWRYVGYDPDEEKLTTRLVADWAYLKASLSYMQRDYDCLDPEMLQQASVVGGRLHVGNGRYDVLVIPPITNLERGAFERLREFINAGGKVICLGLLPIEDIQDGPSVVEALSRMTDMEPARMIRDYIGHELGVHVVQRGNLYLIRTGGSVEKNLGARAMGDLLDQILPRRVTVETDKKGALTLLCHQRQDGKEHIYFLTNTSRVAFNSRIGLQVPSKQKKVERWDLETGRRASLPAVREGNRLTIDLSFERLQSHLIVVSEGKAQTSCRLEAPEQLPLDLSGLWKVDPEEDNLLRLDRFRMQIDPQNRGIKQGWHKPDYRDSRWLTVEPKPLVEQIRERSTFSNLPISLASDGSGLPLKTEIELPLVCWFRTAFWADTTPGKLALVMDRSAILGNHQIYLNGSRMPSNTFRPTFRYDHANVTSALGRRVSKGKNVLAVRVEVDELTEGLVDAFYLFGRFGVTHWRSHYLRLTAPVEKGPLGRLDDLKMPFYAGTVAYTRNVVFPECPKTGHFVISLEKAFKDVSDIVELQVNGHSLGVRAWAPYHWTGETAWLKQGKNRVTLRITNTLTRLLTGCEFQPKAHRIAPVKV